MRIWRILPPPAQPARAVPRKPLPTCARQLARRETTAHAGKRAQVNWPGARSTACAESQLIWQGGNGGLLVATTGAEKAFGRELRLEGQPECTAHPRAGMPPPVPIWRTFTVTPAVAPRGQACAPSMFPVVPLFPPPPVYELLGKKINQQEPLTIATLSSRETSTPACFVLSLPGSAKPRVGPACLPSEVWEMPTEDALDQKPLVANIYGSPRLSCGHPARQRGTREDGLWPGPLEKGTGQIPGGGESAVGYWALQSPDVSSRLL